ncbi:MAG TPA: DUF998 domain-containing protein [Candidatus Saccharimonadales bacterium]|nr:DUF998 domain-containing protein [Candidatus Saccharimonadales bacterium]
MKQSRFRWAFMLCLAALIANNYWLLAPELGIPSTHLVSALEVTGQPDAMLFRAISVVAGLLLVGSVWLARHDNRRQQYLRWIIAVLGVCISIDGIFAINCEDCQLSSLNAIGWVHGIESSIYVLAILLGTFLTMRWRVNRLIAKLQLGSVVVYLGLHAMVLLSLQSGGAVLQRITLSVETILLLLLWIDMAHMPDKKHTH